MANICVFCSSSDEIDEGYYKVAEEMGNLIGRNGFKLVYGGVNKGCMEYVAKGAREEGADVIGILPVEFRNHPKRMSEAVLVDSLHHRKAEMELRSDAFVALAGGLGTLDEFMSVIATKQVKAHNKPIVAVNTNSFYKNLGAHLSMIDEKKFGRTNKNRLYRFVETPQDAIDNNNCCNAIILLSIKNTLFNGYISGFCKLKGD
jgi:cytokinin riboside 5'-monophosphate phosphoribohydrolase